jgi:hypothetical protein
MQDGISINSIDAVPGSPDATILTLSNGVMAIYDRDRPRANTAATSVRPLFVTPDRAFLKLGGQCWTWADFDATGFTNVQSCVTEPAEVRHDHGLTYLSDGNRNFPVSLPTAGLVAVPIQAPQFAMDPARRRVFQLSPSNSLRALATYNMDNQEQRTLFMIGSSGFYSGLWINENGEAVVLSYPYVTIVK